MKVEGSDTCHEHTGWEKGERKHARSARMLSVHIRTQTEATQTISSRARAHHLL